MSIDCKFTFKILTPVLLLFWRVLCFGDTYASKTAPVAVFEYKAIHFNHVNVDCALSDTIKRDSVKISARKNKDSLDAPVNYHADDSIKYDIANGKIYLFGNAHVDYKDISLDAAYIVFDWKNNMVHAEGMADSTGKINGKPNFKEGGETYKAEVINFNFKSKKGRITEGLTQEGGGYVHSDVVKKAADKIYFAKNAYYTTCDEDTPHFYIVASRAEIIPGKLLVTGPADLVVEGVPTPLFVPFGIFPLSDGQHSGIIVPSYGFSSSYGYYLQNGGYYFALGQHLDLKLEGDIYSFGGWRANVITDYAERYAYNGTFNFALANTISGDKAEGTYESAQNYSLLWSFNQDPKARPYSRFSINIDAASARYNQIYTYNPDVTLNSTLNSNVTYNKTFQGTPFNLTVNLTQNQNIQTHLVDLTLPSVDFDMNTIYPFASSNSAAPPTWYSKIGITYTFSTINNLNGYDSVLFKKFNPSQLQWSALHNIPISTSFKAFKYFTISPSFDYEEFWYDQSIREKWNPQLNEIQIDTEYKFASGREFTFSVAATTTLYGQINFKHGKIKAIRHVLTPSISVAYHPDFSKFGNNFYDSVQTDNTGKHFQSYSIFQNSAYGGPPTGKYGGVGLALGNNLEMKVYSKKDTINHTKKITLLNNLSISTFYNLASDTLQWQPVTVSGNTALFNVINVNFAGQWDEYASNNEDERIDTFEYNVDHKLLRLTSAALNISTTLKSLTTGKTNPSASTQVAGNQTIYFLPDDFTDIKTPYNLGIGYLVNLSHSKTLTNQDTLIYTQSLTFSGGITLTPLWKITASSGYDFVRRQLSYTLVSITRDLHCWYMSFTWVPVGYSRSYFLTIGVRSGVLQQLKLPVLHSPNTSSYTGD